MNFSTKYMSLVRECIPEKTVTIRPKDKPWFDSTLRKTIRKRDRLRNIALKYKRESDLSKYRKIRNQVNNMKKHAHPIIMTTLISTCTKRTITILNSTGNY